MNVKTGIDIIEVKRIKQSIEKYTDSFLNRVFTNSEIEYCEARKTQKFQSYAGRFAAKEAIFKAVSEKLENKFSIEWKDIEIINDENGRPFVNFYGKLKEIIGDNYEIDVSISHIGEYAVASVVFLIGFLIGDGENFKNLKLGTDKKWFLILVDGFSIEIYDFQATALKSDFAKKWL